MPQSPESEWTLPIVLRDTVKMQCSQCMVRGHIMYKHKGETVAYFGWKSIEKLSWRGIKKLS